VEQGHATRSRKASPTRCPSHVRAAEKNIDLIEGIAMRAKAAYDYQFPKSGSFDEGILWAGLGLGVGI
jgi:hypothetical protein